MNIIEEVANLKIAADAGREAAQRLGDVEQYLDGVRAGMVGEEAPETDTVARDDGRREGTRLRRIARMDLEGFRAGVLGETYGDGSHPAFVAGWEEGRKAVASREADQLAVKVDRDDLAFQTSTVAAIMGDPMPEGGSPLGYEKGRRVRGDWERLPSANAKELDGIRKAIRHSKLLAGDDVDPHESTLSLVRRLIGRIGEGEVDAPRIGGNPPAPEIGMVYRNGDYALMVNALPWAWPIDVTEIRAPWGGPVVWRRE